MARPVSARRRLKRLRALLVVLACTTAMLISAACRFESAARAAAAFGVLVCLVAWIAVLEIEGRVADHLERQGRARPTTRARRVAYGSHRKGRAKQRGAA